MPLPSYSVSSTIRAAGNAEPLICMTGIGKSDVGPQTRVGQQPAFQSCVHIGSVCCSTPSGHGSAPRFVAARTGNVCLNIDNPFFAFFVCAFVRKFIRHLFNEIVPLVTVSYGLQ